MADSRVSTSTTVTASNLEGDGARVAVFVSVTVEPDTARKVYLALDKAAAEAIAGPLKAAAAAHPALDAAALRDVLLDAAGKIRIEADAKRRTIWAKLAAQLDVATLQELAGADEVLKRLDSTANGPQRVVAPFVAERQAANPPAAPTVNPFAP